MGIIRSHHIFEIGERLYNEDFFPLSLQSLREHDDLCFSILVKHACPCFV